MTQRARVSGSSALLASSLLGAISLAHCSGDDTPPAVIDGGVDSAIDVVDAGVTDAASDANAEVERAVAFAEAGSWEPVEDLLRDVHTTEDRP